ncbi:hypothetical protein DL93DRAFT_1796689 [Clavulina sp. PMI_390]|nr:hypothetical protein DL93DRAFT_1796689 [Clavulina sp. PMI_390]
MLDKPIACLQCRKQKLKCDGLKPWCSRCNRLSKECSYPSGVIKRPRGPLTEALQTRILELEMIIHKLTLPSTHNLSMASSKLIARSQRLGSLPKPVHLPKGSTPSAQLPAPGSADEREAGRPVESLVEDPYTLQRFIAQELRSYNLEELEELPLSLSIHLINLFLPSYSHYYFLVDVPHFMACVSLPRSHPDAIHPCLLNACYLGACANSGGGLLAPFTPHFLQRTRRFLHQSLMLADRPTHFLWASVVLGVFFAKERRLLECLSVAEGLARFALACGLNLPDHSTKAYGSAPSEYLLPPPKNKAEADERIRLAHSIYVGCQALPLLWGNPPIFPYDDQWSPIPEESSTDGTDEKIPANEGNLWRTEMHLKVLVINTFERATQFARSITENGQHRSEKEYLSIESQIHAQQASLPRLFDPHTRQALEASDAMNSHSVFGYITLYGSGLILHNSWAVHHPESRPKMLECLQALVDICSSAREHRRLYLGLVNSVHIMNAVRVIARELRRSEARNNHVLSIDHCRSVELLLDFLDDIMLLFPAWVEAPVALKDSLVAAANSLSP